MVNNLSTDSKVTELIAGCLKNNKLSQRKMYEWLSPGMYAVCLRYVGEQEAAKDVMHDGFVTLFSKLKSYKGEGSFEGWARRIFITASLMHLRKKDVLRYSNPIDDYAGIVQYDSKVVENMDSQTLLRIIAAMPAGFRTVFNMYAIEGYSHQEIARQLGITEGGSRSQFSRARIWLQEKLKNFE